MKYKFNEDNISLIERICKINNINPIDLDVSSFIVDKDIEVLNRFKDTLLSYKDKRFFIVGDYDCDGICATTIMKKLLDDLNIKNNYYIPSRVKQGYGINKDIVDIAINNNFEVILCVDNGVVAYEQLNYAKQNNINTLVIDHHEYEKEVEVDALLHPSLFDDKYADMCASGISCLLSNYIREDELSIVYAGLASLADMVKVLGYNRYLITKMHELLNTKSFKTINNLINGKIPTYENLQFEAIPKINAISRLEEDMNVNYMVKYLLNYDNEVNKYIDTIISINNKRKDLTNMMYNLANRLVDIDNNVLIVESDKFLEGLCGLLANRLMNEYHKPVIVLSRIGNTLKGSARSLKGSNLYDYLSNIKDVFDNFGGHSQAIGLSISLDNYDKLLDYIKSNEFKYKDNFKDVLVFNQNEIDLDLLNKIDALKPFGSYFEEPLIGIKNPNIINKFKVKQLYPKYVLNDKLEAISFKDKEYNNDFTYMIGKISKDSFNNSKVSMIIEDLV